MSTTDALGFHLQWLQVSTTSDTTRSATLVVGLDEKVDRLDDTLEDLEAKLDRLIAGARPTETRP